MPISSDPLKRKWLDVTSVNPQLVNQFRPSLVSFLAFDRNRRAQFMGSGFVVGDNKQYGYGMVFTANHVLDGIKDFQRPEQRHAISALPEFIVQQKISIEPSDLKVLWMGEKDASMMNVVYPINSEQLDIAGCVIKIEETDKFLPVAISLDFRTPSIGDTVHMVSCAGMKFEETIAPQRQDGAGQHFKLERAVNIRIGTVTGVYQEGLRDLHFPCFTTSIPVEPGMSGGFVYLPEDGAPVAACGVVCRDLSTIGQRRNSMLSSGLSVISCTWPMLGLSFFESVPVDEATPKITIYDMIKLGRLKIYGTSIDQFKVIKLNGDTYRVQRKA